MNLNLKEIGIILAALDCFADTIEPSKELMALDSKLRDEYSRLEDEDPLTHTERLEEEDYYREQDADRGSYDLSDDAEALASAGFGTDEDYGG